MTGYMRITENSFCMDNCSIYYLESEDGEFLSYITYLDSIEILDYYNINRIRLCGAGLRYGVFFSEVMNI